MSASALEFVVNALASRDISGLPTLPSSENRLLLASVARGTAGGMECLDAGSTILAPGSNYGCCYDFSCCGQNLG